MSKQKNPHKKAKFEERLVAEINVLLRRSIGDARLKNVSITKAEMSPDYAYANVYWDTYEASTRGDAKRGLEHSAGHIRSSLASLLEVRHVPALSFIYDNQYAEEEKIVHLLKKANAEVLSESSESLPQ
jgi:ribosome-binding factor A